MADAAFSAPLGQLGGAVRVGLWLASDPRGRSPGCRAPDLRRPCAISVRTDYLLEAQDRRESAGDDPAWLARVHRGASEVMTRFCCSVISSAGRSRCMPAAHAHEVRPAYLEIGQPDANVCRVVWKQPMAGELALRLIAAPVEWLAASRSQPISTRRRAF